VRGLGATDAGGTRDTNVGLCSRGLRCLPMASVLPVGNGDFGMSPFFGQLTLAVHYIGTLPVWRLSKIAHCAAIAAPGTKRRCQNVRYSVAIGGKADLCRTGRSRRAMWTSLDLRQINLLASRFSRTILILTAKPRSPTIEWGSMMAAASMITLPVLVLALCVQRYIVRGLVSGAVAG
jgi:hypothetical protein